MRITDGVSGRMTPSLCAGLLLLAVCAAAAALSGGVVAAHAPDEGPQGWTVQRRGAAGQDLNAVYFVDGKRGWVAGDGGLVLRTQDGGRNWTPQAIDTKQSINDIYFRDKEDGYLLAGNQIFMTDDAGQTWRGASRFLPSDFGGAVPELYSVRFTSKKKGWIVGSVSRRDSVVDSLVVYTQDGGVTWQRKRVPTRAELIHLDFDGDKRGWIVGNAGVVLHTNDAGETWTQQKTNTNATLYHVDFDDEDTGWVVGERGTILRTADGGQTWRTIIGPVRSTLLSVEFAGEDDGWIVGRGGVILRSGDGGQTWVIQESHTKQHLYALFIEKKVGWAVGADGLVLRYVQ